MSSLPPTTEHLPKTQYKPGQKFYLPSRNGGEWGLFRLENQGVIGLSTKLNTQVSPWEPSTILQLFQIKIKRGTARDQQLGRRNTSQRKVTSLLSKVPSQACQPITFCCFASLAVRIKLERIRREFLLVGTQKV